MSNYYTVAQVAKILEISISGVGALLKRDKNPNRARTRFPNMIKRKGDIFIPEQDVQAEIKFRAEQKQKVKIDRNMYRKNWYLMNKDRILATQRKQWEEKKLKKNGNNV